MRTLLASLPGEHGPTGPIADLVEIKVSGNGQPIPRKRDLVNMFAFHVDVPNQFLLYPAGTPTGLVKETDALYGARYYRDYHCPLSLSDHVAHFGLEHHESSDDRISERRLPHEFTHSWNGKYRRPVGTP